VAGKPDSNRSSAIMSFTTPLQYDGVPPALRSCVPPSGCRRLNQNRNYSLPRLGRSAGPDALAREGVGQLRVTRVTADLADVNRRQHTILAGAFFRERALYAGAVARRKRNKSCLYSITSSALASSEGTFPMRRGFASC
jgi:hypothetical protein